MKLYETDFAVLDLETTGLFPAKHDRIVEVAIIRMGCDGRLAQEYATLVNPGRDLGPTAIHGIKARDVLDAPTFADIVGDVLQRLGKAIVVAHNVQFDSSFLVAECLKAGVDLPPFPTLCTLRLSTVLTNGLSGRRLSDCCEHFGVAHENKHSAYFDAKACAQLLAKCLQLASTFGIETVEDLLGQKGEFPPTWPERPPSGRSLRRTDAEMLRKFQPNYIARLVTRVMALPSMKRTGPNEAVYLDLLDRVLEDRLVTEAEGESLLQVARANGLTGQRLVELHLGYLGSLAEATLADGVVTDQERVDLNEVALLLGFDNMVVDDLLADVRATPIARDTAPAKPTVDLAGRSVCFTGTLLGKLNGEAITRNHAEDLATKAGLIVMPSVTKALDILVVADPLTMSTKAKKARDYGIRIMAEIAFWRAIGAAVE